MERLDQTKPKGLSAGGLRFFAVLFLAAGVVSRCILQNRILGMGQLSAQELLEVMSASSSAMVTATVALVLQALETCAIPMFCLLLVEGFQHSRSRKRYLLRLAIVAAISEVPYNLAMSGSWLDLSSRNPVFGMILGLVMLYLFRQFGEKTASHRFIKAMVVVFALLWANMLSISHGTATVILTGVLWLSRNRRQFRSLLGAAGSMLCTLISPYYLLAAMGCLPVHLYNGEKGAENRVVNYLVYPVILIASVLVAYFVI